MPRKSYVGELRWRVHALDDTNIKNQLEEIKAFIDDKYANYAHMYCVIKKLIHETYPQFDKEARAILHDTKEGYAKRQEEAAQRVMERNECVTTFSHDYVMDRIRVLKDSLYVYEQLVALQLACGCRQRDLFDGEMVQFEEASYVIDEEKTKFVDMVKQIGSSKKRLNKPDIPVIIKPLLGMSFDEFKEKIDDFRSRIVDPKQACAVANQPMCRITEHYFPLRGTGPNGTHVNRALYAAVLRYRSADFKSGPLMVKQALGHDSMSTAPHYMHVNVSTTGDEGPVVPFEDSKGNVRKCVRPARKYGCDEARERDKNLVEAFFTEYGIECTKGNFALVLGMQSEE